MAIYHDIGESEIYEAVKSAGGDDREAYDFMALHTDIVYNDHTYSIVVGYDSKIKLFHLTGDVTTGWIDYTDCINILCAFDSSLWDLPAEGEDGVIRYSYKVHEQL